MEKTFQAKIIRINYTSIKIPLEKTIESDVRDSDE